jgi:hypothetical protein
VTGVQTCALPISLFFNEENVVIPFIDNAIPVSELYFFVHDDTIISIRNADVIFKALLIILFFSFSLYV